MARHERENLGFEALAEGDEWESAGRTLTETDVVNFAGLSGDYTPIHVDHHLAAAGPFGKPVAHGLLGLAFVSGLGSDSPRVRTMAFLQILEWKFVEPIYFGDTLRVLTRIEKLEVRSRGRRGVVTWYRRLVNQHGKTVQEGRTQTLVERSPAPRAPDSTTPPPPAP